MALNNFTIDNAKHTFKTRYFSALSAVSPLIILGLSTFAMENWTDIDIQTIQFKIIMFFVSAITSYLTYSFTLMHVRGDEISLEEAMNPNTKIVFYLMYASVIYGIFWLFTYQFQIGSFDLTFLYRIVQPFGDFIANANSEFGFIVRFMIVANVMIFFFVQIAILLLHKFLFIPFLIAEEQTPVIAVVDSWRNSTKSTWLIIRCLNYIYFVSAVIFNIIIFTLFIVLINDPFNEGFINFISYLVTGVLWFYIYPLSYTVLGELFLEAN